MNITQLDSGTWRARVYVGRENGVQKYESFAASTRAEVELLAAQYQAKLKRNRAEQRKPLEKRMTVGDAIDKYIEINTSILSPFTIKGYANIRKNDFPMLMDIKLCELTQLDIQNAVNLDAKRHAPKSVRNSHGLLSSALEMFLPDFELKTKLPAAIEADVYIPEDDDIQQLVNRIRNTRMESAVLLGACVGMRRSEISGLALSDLNVKKNTIRIHRTVVKDEKGNWIVRENTKTKKSKREVETSPGLIHRLQELAAPGDFLVGLLPDTITKNFCNIRNELGFSFRFHDLRHYNASIMLALNIPDKYAMERMGYSTPATLKKVYQHTMNGRRKEVSDAVNSHMNTFREKKHNV